MELRPGIELANLSDVGCEREGNEDYFGYAEPEDDAAFAKKGRLIIVADGMGGEERGVLASTHTLRVVSQHLEKFAEPLPIREDAVSTLIERAFQQANAEILALAAITVRFVPAGWPGLKSAWLRPMILCGQHSLEIFSLGVFLAFTGYFVLTEVSAGIALPRSGLAGPVGRPG